MDGKGWIKPTFHPLALGPPVIFRRFAKNQPREKEQHLPKVQDESHAFVNHTSPNARSPPPSPSSALRTTSSAASPSASRARPLLLSAPPLSPSLRARPHACSSAQLIVRRPTSIMSTAGASYGRLQPSATAPALHGTSERQSTPGRPSQMALRPQPQSHNWLPEGLDPNPRPATVGPNLAYTNYHALSTPLVRRWVRTPREPANVPPAKPGYYAAHEIWPSTHHAPGVQHHLRPLRSSTALGTRERGHRQGANLGDLEFLEARGQVSEGKQALDSMVHSEKVPPRFPLPRGRAG